MMMKFKSFILLALLFLFVCSILAVQDEIKGDDETKEINKWGRGGRGGGRYCKRQYCCGGWGLLGCKRYCCRSSSGVEENDDVEPDNHWGGGEGGHGGGKGGGGKGGGGKGGGGKGGGGGHGGVDENEKVEPENHWGGGDGGHGGGKGGGGKGGGGKGGGGKGGGGKGGGGKGGGEGGHSGADETEINN